MENHTNLDIIDLMVELEEKLEEKYNASLVLTGYGQYLETFLIWSKELQQKVLDIKDNQSIDEFLDLVETREVNYFDIVFN